MLALADQPLLVLLVVWQIAHAVGSLRAPLWKSTAEPSCSWQDSHLSMSTITRRATLPVRVAATALEMVMVTVPLITPKLPVCTAPAGTPEMLVTEFPVVGTKL